MVDLTDFGVDAPTDSDDATGEADATDGENAGGGRRTYRTGRCPAINTGSRTRCRAPTSRMNDAEPFCGTHGRARDPWTIHDDPETLILLTGELDALSLDDLDPDDVDFDLQRIRAAVEEVTADGS